MSTVTQQDQESQRLRVLESFDILDTDEEASFDDFTRLVSDLLDVPIALISLVDEQRQWFKSYVGLDVRETDRDVAFCDHAIRGEEALIVPDALEDERFRTNPLVVDDPGIRFYAGVPLVSSEGQALGTLCAIDTRPRALSESQRDILATLARQVMCQLELRRLTTRTLRAEVKRLELEVRLQETQRLDSLSILAGGIAHDFNNLLVSILGNANLASLELPEGSPIKATIAKIETASMRAAELTKQMLAYSGTGRHETTVIDLSKVVEEMGSLLEVAISRKVVLNFDLAKDATSCKGDLTQVRQVIMNLLVNGSDSIGDRSGMITVRTGMQRLTEESLRPMILNDRVAAGDFVFVEVRDTGIGMPEETRARMFDPFFTTKKKGRGLGLAAVLGIVRSHAGTIRVESAEGVGTRVRVLFPSVPADLLEEMEGPLPRRGKGELILVIDDEEHVRAVTESMLETVGFQVISAADGREGAQLYAQHQARIDLVLTDMTMPHVDGIGTLKAIREIDSEVPIIMMSGHNEMDVTTVMAGRQWSGFLQKPFLCADLLELILPVLEESRANSQRKLSLR